MQYSQLYSQTEEVREGLQEIADGNIDDVKQRLPDLLADYPNDPGVRLLHAVVIEDGYKAVEKYLSIITDFPNSEWADDAYWRIVQFYAILGDTLQAKLHLNNYRKKYPDSDFLLPATDAVKISLFRGRKNTKAKDFTEEEIEIEETPVVEKKVIVPEVAKTEKPKDKVTESGKGKYGLQVGIYSTYDAAKMEVERFKNMRMLAEIKQKKLGNETMHAVVIGDYATKASAENAKLIVQQQCKCIPIIFEK
jgi:hypothetical protein